MFYRYGPFGFHGPGLFGWLFFVLVLTAVVLLVVSVARSWRAGPGHHPQRGGPWPAHPGMDPALSALRVAYARGEITWEEFTRRAANLGYPVTPGAPPGGPPAGGPPPGATVGASPSTGTPPPSPPPAS
ncbi:MAG TPA: SHOCT domain-containing protein [Acidimicrobiales bacterium]|nr:SHOCT domain-containing protein [Acidimicrobiales bacterium]